MFVHVTTPSQPIQLTRRHLARMTLGSGASRAPIPSAMRQPDAQECDIAAEVVMSTELPTGLSFGVFSSVSIHWLVASLPPNCPRSRLKDAKTRPPGPGFSTRFPCK